MLRKPLAVLVASAMVLSSGAFAASDTSSQQQPTNTAKNQAPLPPAGPAGIQKAIGDDDDTTLYIIGGVILIGGILAIVLANNGHSTSSTH